MVTFPPANCLITRKKPAQGNKKNSKRDETKMVLDALLVGKGVRTSYTGQANLSQERKQLKETSRAKKKETKMALDAILERNGGVRTSYTGRANLSQERKHVRKTTAKKEEIKKPFGVALTGGV